NPKGRREPPSRGAPPAQQQRRLSFAPRKFATPRGGAVFLPPKPRQQQDQKTSHADETISQDAIHGCYPAAAGAALSRGGHPSQSTHTQSGKRPHQRSSEAYGKQECDECTEAEITDQDCGCGAIVTVR